MREKGNLDLTRRPVVGNPDGSYSTVRSMAFDDDKGGVTLIPTVSDTGKVMDPREALLYHYMTGGHLGKFDNTQEADTYAEQLHKDQEKQYGDIIRQRAYLEGH